VLRIAREKEARVEVKKLRGRLRKVILVKSSSDDEDEVSNNLVDSFIKTPRKRRRGVVLSHVEI
jgi:hypothetical protein